MSGAWHHEYGEMREERCKSMKEKRAIKRPDNGSPPSLRNGICSDGEAVQAESVRHQTDRQTCDSRTKGSRKRQQTLHAIHISFPRRLHFLSHCRPLSRLPSNCTSLLLISNKSSLSSLITRQTTKRQERGGERDKLASTVTHSQLKSAQRLNGRDGSDGRRSSNRVPFVPVTQ